MNRFTPTSAVDIHQHLWTAPFLAALRRRSRPPRLRGWTLELAGEPEYVLDPSAHDVGLRTAQLAADGLDRALISISGPLGVESLPGSESRELLDAYHEGARSLPAPLRSWAAACLAHIDPAALARRLEEGFIGLSLPATALGDEAGYVEAAPLLCTLEACGRPLFVHPGPAAGHVGPAGRGVGTDRGDPAGGGVLPWWPALVPYVAQMHAAWYAFLAWGRPRHPRLRVCFAMLAGLAPLHGERLAARGGPRSPFDENVFLDTSGYGPRAVDVTVRVVGIDALVNGSDRPYAEPVVLPGEAASFAVRHANPSRLLHTEEVSDELAVAART